MSNFEGYAFFAMLDRMQYIQRWSLMRNSRTENIKEHSFDVAVIAHALAILHNKHEGALKIDPEKVQSYAIYHDCTEIITGDLPTPIKYKNKDLTKAFHNVEDEAAEDLVELLPDCMKETYKELLCPAFEGEEGILTKRLVKAADRISAYIKCMREQSSGSREFDSAMKTIKSSIDKIDLPEVREFMEMFIPAFGMTLDQLSGEDTE